jgi:dolichyl-diphosphooligosaccharide--protein glycosyltransferase
MIRIAQGVWPNEVVESKFFTPQGEYEVARPTDTMKNSLMYKMSYFRFGDLYGQGVGSDRVRGVQVNTKDINLDTLEEAFSSEHLIVRIYKVKPLDVLGRPLIRQSAGKKNRKRSK